MLVAFSSFALRPPLLEPLLAVDLRDVFFKPTEPLAAAPFLPVAFFAPVLAAPFEAVFPEDEFFAAVDDPRLAVAFLAPPFLLAAAFLVAVEADFLLAPAVRLVVRLAAPFLLAADFFVAVAVDFFAVEAFFVADVERLLDLAGAPFLLAADFLADVLFEAVLFFAADADGALFFAVDAFLVLADFLGPADFLTLAVFFAPVAFLALVGFFAVAAFLVALVLLAEDFFAAPPFFVAADFLVEVDFLVVDPFLAAEPFLVPADFLPLALEVEALPELPELSIDSFISFSAIISCSPGSKIFARGHSETSPA